MEALFWDIVRLFNQICRASGLSYASLNILVYVLLAPATWALALVLRQRRYLPILLVHASLCAAYLWRHKQIEGWSQSFYDANIAALTYLGEEASRAGYIGVSMAAGVAAPVLLFLALLLAPARRALALYIAFVLFNALYYAWALYRF